MGYKLFWIFGEGPKGLTKFYSKHIQIESYSFWSFKKKLNINILEPPGFKLLSVTKVAI